MNEAVKLEQDYIPMPAKLISIENITRYEKLYTLNIENGQKIYSKPCQFVMVSLFGFGEAPISICSGPDDDKLQLCVRKVGMLTSRLHELKVGDLIGIRGPYGNGFPVDVLKDKDVLLIGGGLGLAPLRSLIRYTMEHRADFKKLTILYGSQKPTDRLFVNEINQWKTDDNIEYHETVDTADQTWNGNVGVITTLFNHIDPDPNKTIAVIVGPPVMYRFVIHELLDRYFNVKQIYVDLERRMRCGLGKCGHCQMNEVYVCQSGPIFSFNDIVDQNLKEAL